MKKLLKNSINCFCIFLIWPFALLCWLEKTIKADSELFFSFFGQLLACAPGLPGDFLRKAYYFLTLKYCSLHCTIGFGSILVHRLAIIEDRVSIGNYAIIGAAHIKSGCEIGSRVSIPSGKKQHAKNGEGKWTAFVPSETIQITIQNDVWIGEGAIVMADVGRGSLVGAGSVVIDPIPESVVAAGNPSKVVKNI